MTTEALRTAPFLFGGTFNPPHKGHLHIIHTVLNHFPDCRIIAVPAFISPFKENRPMLPFDVRVRLLRLSLEDYRAIYPSDDAGRADVSAVEGEIGRKVFTSELVARVKEKFGVTDRVTYIAGDDILSSLDRWHDADYLKANVRFAIVPRKPGESACAERVGEGFVVEMVPGEILEASSTDVRGGRLDMLTPSVRAELDAIGSVFPESDSSR